MKLHGGLKKNKKQTGDNYIFEFLGILGNSSESVGVEK